LDDADVRSVFRPVLPEEPQVLMRQVSEPQGWWLRKTPWYELRWHPNGRDQPPEWVKTTRAPYRDLPGHVHTTDWWDVRQLIERGWHEHDPRFVAWPLEAITPTR